MHNFNYLNNVDAISCQVSENDTSIVCTAHFLDINKLQKIISNDYEFTQACTISCSVRYVMLYGSSSLALIIAGGSQDSEI